MLKEILEGASHREDFELTLSSVTKILKEINRKSSSNVDARTSQALENAKKELETVLRRL